MTVTVAGVACRERDITATYTRHGTLHSAEAFDTLAEELPDDGVAVTIGHGGEAIGTLIYGEINPAWQVSVVCVVHDDAILKIDGPIFPVALWARGRMEPESVMCPRRPRRPHRAGAGNRHRFPRHEPDPPAPRHVGSSTDRAGWPISWATEDPLLHRCVETLGTRQRVSRLVRELQVDRLDRSTAIVDGELVAFADRSGRQAFAPDGTPLGPMWHREGTILSVR